MEQLISKLYSFYENVGTGYSIGLLIIILICVFSLHYMFIVFESYLRAGSIKYGKYNVTVKDGSGFETVFTVRSFGKTHAIEKVAKKQKGLESLTFKVLEKRENN